VRATFENPKARCSQSVLNARLLVEEKHGVTLVSTAAVQRNSQATYVYVVKADSTGDRCGPSPSARRKATTRKSLGAGAGRGGGHDRRRQTGGRDQSSTRRSPERTRVSPSVSPPASPPVKSPGQEGRARPEREVLDETCLRTSRPRRSSPCCWLQPAARWGRITKRPSAAAPPAFKEAKAPRPVSNSKGKGRKARRVGKKRQFRSLAERAVF